MSFGQYWPVFPEDQPSTNLVHVDAKCDAETLFLVLFGPLSTFQVRLASSQRVARHSEHHSLLRDGLRAAVLVILPLYTVTQRTAFTTAELCRRTVA
jgi:hypothetical protein